MESAVALFWENRNTGPAHRLSASASVLNALNMVKNCGVPRSCSTVEARLAISNKVTSTRPKPVLPRVSTKDYQRQVSWLVSLQPAFPELRFAPVARKGQQLKRLCAQPNRNLQLRGQLRFCTGFPIKPCTTRRVVWHRRSGAKVGNGTECAK